MAEEKKAVVKQKQPGRVARWFRELKAEFKKIIWPSRKQVINNTLVVIACVLLVGIFIWVLDLAFGFGRDIIISKLG